MEQQGVQGNQCIGTLRREQRANLPEEIMMGSRGRPTVEAVKTLKRGQMLFRHSNYGNGKFYFHLQN